MRHLLGEMTIKGRVLFGVLGASVLAIVVGLLVAGGTGTTIVAIGGGLLAFTIICIVGFPNSPMERRGPWDRDQ